MTTRRRADLILALSPAVRKVLKPIIAMEQFGAAPADPLGTP